MSVKTPTLAEVVKDTRARKFLSQSELAKISGVSLQTIRDVEQGVIKKYSKIILYRLEQALDIQDTFLVKKSQTEYENFIKNKK